VNQSLLVDEGHGFPRGQRLTAFGAFDQRCHFVVPVAFRPRRFVVGRRDHYRPQALQ
jgi:hypothetical protein